MKRLAAGVLAFMLATSIAVFTSSTAAEASSPYCTTTANNPFVDTDIQGFGQINCTQQATVNQTVYLWRYNGDGTYTGYHRSYSGLVTDGYGYVTTPCVKGYSRIWHTESSISWKIYSGANLVASGSTYDNSGTVSLPCH